MAVLRKIKDGDTTIFPITDLKGIQAQFIDGATETNLYNLIKNIYFINVNDMTINSLNSAITSGSAMAGDCYLAFCCEGNKNIEEGLGNFTSGSMTFVPVSANQNTTTQIREGQWYNIKITAELNPGEVYEIEIAEINLLNFYSETSHWPKSGHNICLGGTNNSIAYTTGGNSAVIGGTQNSASGSQIQNCLVLGGHYNNSYGANAVSIAGYNTIARYNQIVTGHFNSDNQSNWGPQTGSPAGINGSAFVIGNGTSTSARSNAFRVTYAGQVYGLSAYNSSGADYAEYFEWVDDNLNNEDRRGLFVTCVEDKIQLANPGDDIIGVISANPSVIGNAQEDTYKGMYEKDIFGAPIKDEDGNYKLNPNYDSSKEYIPYSERPEFGIVGLLGQLIVVDDGTCTAGGYCTSGNNGIGTKSDKGYKVLKRIDSNHIKILVK